MRWTCTLFAVLFLCASLAHATEFDEEIYNRLQKHTTVGVIVELHGIEPPSVLETGGPMITQRQLEVRKLRIQQKREKVLNRLNLHPASVQNRESVITREYSTINAFAGNITSSILERLVRDPDVKSIYLMRELKVQLDDTRTQIVADRVQQKTYNEVSINGRGETICVLDTGIDYNHVNLGNGLGNVVIDGYDYVNDDSDPLDDHSHGTHVAGIIASDHGTYKGIAPGAKLVAIKVCDSLGTCNSQDMIAGVDWCVNNASIYNISVITISIGDETEYNSSDCPSWLDSSLSTARSMGIVVTVSSGNDGFKNGISYPACSPMATAIAAVSKQGDITGYSDTAESVDLLAPGGTDGVQITSTALNGGFTGKYGTSMAAPHAAASVALIQQFSRLQDNVSLSPENITSLLHGTGSNVTDPANGLSFSLLNVYEAIVSIDKEPVITITEPENGLVTDASEHTIIVSSNEPLSHAFIEWNNTNISMNGVNAMWNYTVQGTGTFFYRVTANDTESHWGSSPVYSITLNNSAPIITAYYPNQPEVNIREPENQTFNISYVEPDSQNVTVVWHRNGSIEGNTPEYSFIGSYFSSGSYNITVIVNDSHLTAAHSWLLIVNNTNRASTVAAAYISPGSPSILSSLVCNNGSLTDPDNDTVVLHYDWYNGSWLNIDSRTLGAGYTSLNSRWNCSITPFDGYDNGSAVVSQTITVNNTAPNITVAHPSAGLISISEPANQSFNITAGDLESAVAVSWLKNGTNMSEFYNLLAYTFIGSFTAAGSYNITALASDGSLDAIRTWILLVNNTNRAPVLQSEIANQRVYQNQNITLNLSEYFSDPDGDNLTYNYNQTYNISVNISLPIATIFPAENWTGTVQMFFNASDGDLVVTSNLFEITTTNDLDGDGHIAMVYGGNDCNDENAAIYPGAACSMECYSGATYDSDCSCSSAGATYTCGSSGGGGGGAPVARTTANSRYYDVIPSGKTTVFEVASQDLAIRKIGFTLNKQRSSVTVRIAEKQDISEEIENPYQYLEIEYSNLLATDLSQVEIDFSVQNSWLEDYDEESVTLNRYEKGIWNPIRATRTSTTATHTYYKAFPPGLSVFAISAKKKANRSIETENNTNQSEAYKNSVPHTEQPSRQVEHPLEAPAIIGTQTPVATMHKNESFFYLLAFLTLIVLTLSTYLYASYELGSRRLHKLEHYIEKRLSLGHLEEEIKKSLVEFGWPEHVVHAHLIHAKNKHTLRKLEHYIAKRLSLGHTEEEIHKALLKMGWHQHHIRKHTKRARKRLMLANKRGDDVL